ncbi:MAG TPA: Spy/CpxP family protein refolding chaperone [Terriglobales bacterium]|jgi:periplasmic protein CpxP/Spy|nr:Spy/CpxP family protein refolding chaperone [Terriglobales bacterium]
MKSIRIRMLTIGAAVLLAAAAAIAQGRHGFGGPGGDFRRMLTQLDLTADQHSQVKAIFEKEKPTMQPLMQQMRQNHSAMEALEASGAFDEAKTRALATQNSQTMIELQVEHARIKSEIMQILTADQKAKLAQIEANRAAHMSKHTAPPPAD